MKRVGKESSAVVLARIDERQKSMTEKLEEIHKEVKATNGRVKALEGWRNKMKGVWIAMLVGGGVIGTVIGWLIK
jgi:F0F1-type ATP synthase assembly protein I